MVSKFNIHTVHLKSFGSNRYRLKEHTFCYQNLKQTADMHTYRQSKSSMMRLEIP